MSYARWATQEEVAKRLEAVEKPEGVTKSGIPLSYDENHLYIDSHEQHNLVIGSTGSGKTQAVILPMLKLSLLAGESIVVNDPNGDIYQRCAGILKDHHYQVLVLDFDDAKYGNSWNPLKLAYDYYHKGEKDKAIHCLEDVGYYLFFEKNDNVDPFWNHSVMDYFTGLALYLFENAKSEEIHFQSICSLSHYLGDKNHGEELLQRLDKNSTIYYYLVSILGAPKDTKGSILSVFHQKIKRYIAREQLSNMLCSTDFDLESIGKGPTALFIISGISNYCNNLIPLLVNQIVDVVRYGEKLTKKMNILLDEFDSMVPIRNFSRMIEGCRSLNIRFTVTIRSYVHLGSMYSSEEAEILKMCFGNLIYLLSDDIYTLEEISKYCGTKEDGEPLISIEDLKTIRIFEGIIAMPRMMPFQTKFLPDYQIPWNFENQEENLPKRKIQQISVYEEKE